MAKDRTEVAVWVIDHGPTASCLERLGDARRIADSMESQVGVLLVESGIPSPSTDFPNMSSDEISSKLIQHGADLVLLAKRSSNNVDIRAENDEFEKSDECEGTRVLAAIAKVDTAINAVAPFGVKIVFAGGEPASREWATLLAAKNGWLLISPVLMVQFRRGRRIVTRLDHSGRKSCQVELDEHETVVVTMRAGVAEACPVDDSRHGELSMVPIVGEAQKIQSHVIPADPATGDIRDARRLVAGGRGLGSKQGFELLHEVADLLGAGVAASRMAVDLGWIDYERQVGQTGKTVSPDLYIACGISGASHHLEGMQDAKHIIAINTDSSSPIMSKAHLGLVADLYPVLQNVKQRLEKQGINN